jgi:hypothetical protein
LQVYTLQRDLLKNTAGEIAALQIQPVEETSLTGSPPFTRCCNVLR